MITKGSVLSLIKSKLKRVINEIKTLSNISYIERNLNSETTN